MQQKTTWIGYLIIGISAYILLFTITSCSERIEYVLNADIIYKNQTTHLIEYYQFNNDSKEQILAFRLEPGLQKKYEIRGGGGSKNQNIEDCCSGILEGYQGRGDILIDYDNGDKCLVYLSGEGSTTANINVAYESREIQTRHYEFIYTFTEEEYNQAVDCE